MAGAGHQIYSIVLSLFLILRKDIKSNLFMRKIRNFLCFFIYSFHLNCPTTEEQITDRQVLLEVPQKDANRNRRSPSCDRTTPANTHPYLQANLLASIMGENPIGKTNKLGEQDFSSTERRIFFSSFPFLKDLFFIFLIFTTM